MNHEANGNVFENACGIVARGAYSETHDPLHDTADNRLSQPLSATKQVSMSVRRFTALGTASQVPTSRRNQHASFLKWDEQGFLFDPGEGTQRRMIDAGISASEITKIFITHFHGDHCLGLSGILQRLSLDGVRHTVDIYYPAGGREYLDNIEGVSSYHQTASVSTHAVTADGVIAADSSLVIHARRLAHPVETYGYRIEEPDGVSLIRERLDSLGLAGPKVGVLKKAGEITHGGKTVRLADVSRLRKGQIFAFIMDTGICEAAFLLAKDADLAVMESTFLKGDEAIAAEYGHLTSLQAGEIAREAGVKTLLLTHFSQRYGPDTDFAADAGTVHADVTQLNDGDVYQLRRQREDTLA